MYMVADFQKFSPKLKMWYREAHREKHFFKYLLSRVIHQPVNQDYAIYPKRFYQTVGKLGHQKRKRNYFDTQYFQQLANSKFTLCPAGDNFWSMRFYEALMCKSIPIVHTPEETYRSNAESELDYRYYLSTDAHIYREDWVAHNYELFLRYHTLEYR